MEDGNCCSATREEKGFFSVLSFLICFPSPFSAWGLAGLGRLADKETSQREAREEGRSNKEKEGSIRRAYRL